MPEFANLLEGYRRFRKEGYTQMRDRFAKLAEGQSPPVMVIACSDSRVDPSMIFDVAPGEIFVVRNVAALAPPFETTPGHHGVSAALEFAVQVLEVAQIVVLGHGRCGGCNAALTGAMQGAKPGEGGFVADWVSLLDDARERIAAEYGTEGREAQRQMEYEAVRQSLRNLRTFPFVTEREKEGNLKLRGAYFAIADGVLHVLDEEEKEFEPIV